MWLFIRTSFPQTVLIAGRIILVAMRNWHINPSLRFASLVLIPCVITFLLTILFRHWLLILIECYHVFIVFNVIHLNLHRFTSLAKPIFNFSTFHSMFGIISIFHFCISPCVIGWWFIDYVFLCWFVKVIFLGFFDLDFFCILHLVIFTD